MFTQKFTRRLLPLALVFTVVGGMGGMALVACFAPNLVEYLPAVQAPRRRRWNSICRSYVLPDARNPGGREADVNIDALPETLTVPEAGQRLRCSPTRPTRALDEAVQRRRFQRG